MLCPNCEQETEGGRFCINCGMKLEDDESAVTTESSSIPSQQQPSSDQVNQEKQNELVEKLKNIGANFAYYFMTLVKRPSEAKNANSNDFISGIISMIIYALFLALGVFLVFRASLAQVGGMGGLNGPELSFFATFLLPLLEFIILLAVVTVLTFSVSRLSEQTLSFTDVLGKYGAYLIPFLLLYVLGLLIGAIGVPSLAVSFVILSMLGALVIAPTLILLEHPAKGFDRIYLLLALYFIVFLACGFLLQSFAKTLFQTLIGGMGGVGGF